MIVREGKKEKEGGNVSVLWSAENRKELLGVNGAVGRCE